MFGSVVDVKMQIFAWNHLSMWCVYSPKPLILRLMLCCKFQFYWMGVNKKSCCINILPINSKFCNITFKGWSDTMNSIALLHGSEIPGSTTEINRHNHSIFLESCMVPCNIVNTLQWYLIGLRNVLIIDIRLI